MSLCGHSVGFNPVAVQEHRPEAIVIRSSVDMNFLSSFGCLTFRNGTSAIVLFGMHGTIKGNGGCRGKMTVFGRFTGRQVLP